MNGVWLNVRRTLAGARNSVHFHAGISPKGRYRLQPRAFHPELARRRCIPHHHDFNAPTSCALTTVTCEPPLPTLVRYSQKGMATTSNKSSAAAEGLKPQFVYLPLIAGWLVPGAGHFLLRKWGRGALLAASILAMFVMGLAMHGKLYSGAQDILELLGMVGDLGNGLLFFVSRILGLGTAQVQVTTGDYGTKFIVVAGLLNVIAAVDAHNLRTGRKS